MATSRRCVGRVLARVQRALAMPFVVHLAPLRPWLLPDTAPSTAAGRVDDDPVSRTERSRVFTTKVDVPLDDFGLAPLLHLHLLSPHPYIPTALAISTAVQAVRPVDAPL